MDSINARVAEALGVTANEITINGMAVHPVTQDVYLSVSRGFGQGALPAVVRVSPDGRSLTWTSARCTAGVQDHGRARPRPALPDRAKDWVVPAAVKYDAKAQFPCGR